MSKFRSNKPPPWRSALLDMASTPHPDPKNVYMHDAQTYTVYDGFEKAKFHYLVLPRLPYLLAPGQSQSQPPTLKAAGGKLNLGSSAKSVPASHLHDVSTLLASPYAAQVLAALRKASDEAIAAIEKEMLETYGTTWAIQRAFHAIPSMDHLHLHIISMDLVSDRLKIKKHYNSFHPQKGYALTLDYVEDLVRQGKTRLPLSQDRYKAMLTGPLQSLHTGEEFKNMPLLKTHLLEHWNRLVAVNSEVPRKKAKIATPPAQADSDSESEPLLPVSKHLTARTPNKRGIEGV